MSDSYDYDLVGIYAIPEISMVGAPEHDLTVNKVPYEAGVARYREIARRADPRRPRRHAQDAVPPRRPPAPRIHCIGTGATELVHVGQAALGLDGGLDYFLRTVFNYPTLAECYKVAALDASNKLRY